MLVLIENVGMLYFDTQEGLDVFLWDMCEAGCGITTGATFAIVWQEPCRTR